MAPSKAKRMARARRRYTEDVKQDAVRIPLDRHSAPPVAEQLGSFYAICFRP